MTINELDRKLEEAMQNSNNEIEFIFETFEQNRDSEFLTKNDFRELSKQDFR